jgi:hypothetical protein
LATTTIETDRETTMLLIKSSVDVREKEEGIEPFDGFVPEST